MYPTLSSEQIQLFSKIQEKKDLCHSYLKNYIDGSTYDEYSFYNSCDNRSCTKCQDHKLRKFRTEHEDQIIALGSIKKPKAWVFTGWVVPIEQLSRKFCRDKLLDLFNLLKQFSLTEFSVHMEIKIQDQSPYNAYLHFHAVSGSINHIKLLEFLWGRKVRYESAVKIKNLGFYVSKYASKVPLYPTPQHEYYYTLLVYKLQMNRFSPKAERGEKNLTYDQQMDLIRKNNKNIEKPDWSILDEREKEVNDLRNNNQPPPDPIAEYNKKHGLTDPRAELPEIIQIRQRYKIKPDNRWYPNPQNDELKPAKDLHYISDIQPLGYTIYDVMCTKNLTNLRTLIDDAKPIVLIDKPIDTIIENTSYDSDKLNSEIETAYLRDKDKFGNPKDVHPFIHKTQKSGGKTLFDYGLET